MAENWLHTILGGAIEEIDDIDDFWDYSDYSDDDENPVLIISPGYPRDPPLVEIHISHSSTGEVEAILKRPDSDSLIDSAVPAPLALRPTSLENRVQDAIESDSDSDSDSDSIDSENPAQTGLDLPTDLDMADPKFTPQLVFVDGSDHDLIQELADVLKISDEITPLLEKDREEALAAVVKASASFNSMPEKDFGPAYNLLIYLVVKQSKDPKKHLPIMCQNLLKPITSSPVNGPGLALAALQTIFNLLAVENPVRYNVLLQILRFVKMHNAYDTFQPMNSRIPRWLDLWDLDDDDKRKVFVEISDAAHEAGEQEDAYNQLLLALKTFDVNDQEELKSEEAQQLSLRALKLVLGINKPWAFDLAALRNLAPVQALSDSHPVYFELLEIFAEQDLEDFNDFNEEHEGFLEKESLDFDVLQTKMRLLTFASLAAAHSQSNEVPYAVIAKALQIPSEDVELWIIDVIRAELVEGRMSQRDKVFRVQKATHRVFSDKQWRELQARIDGWRATLLSVSGVLRKSQAEAEAAREREAQEIERKLQQATLGEGQQGGSGGQRRGGDRGDRGGRNQQQQTRQRTDDDD